MGVEPKIGEAGGPGASVVIGAAGGIGRALVEALLARAAGPVHALSRCGDAPQGAVADRADVTDEASLGAAAGRIGGPVELVIVATGLLAGASARPERRLAELSPEGLAESFRVNAIGPALAAKHFVPRLRRDRRAMFVALSARVGSISDNRLGGWHGYRASKAALNMLVRNAAIEARRTHPLAIVVALHPGTVDTPLSRPFQRGVAPERLFTPARAAEQLLRTADGLTIEQSGGLFAWDGSPIAF